MTATSLAPDTTALADRRLNLLDRAFLTLDGRDQPIVTLALDCEGPAPTAELLMRRVTDRLALVPALRTDLASVPKRVLRIDVTDVDDETDRIVRSPFDLASDSPPWNIRLLTRSGSSTFFRVCLSVHHGLLDGVGATHALATLLPDVPSQGARLHTADRPGTRSMARALRDMAAALAHRSAWIPPPASSRHEGRCSAHRDVPVSTLRALADFHGTSLNDVSLAALGVALAASQHQGTPTQSRHDVVAGIPVSTRTTEERHHAGNLVGVYRLTFPHRIGSLEEAIKDIRTQIAEVRDLQLRDAYRKLGKPSAARLGVRATRSMLTPRSTPLVVSSVSFPEEFTVFGAELRAASMLLNVFDDFPAYVSFTRTPDNVRCTSVADEARSSLLDLPERWAEILRRA
ncbi:hypothetical protein ACFC5Z_41355 [Streptomyces sp. NPDC056004]|uniref:hypothetical protein n=1 Tax=Streptomyces sp. NPDC056004 TaxID=3345677 RepID=UPI0035D5502B